MECPISLLSFMSSDLSPLVILLTTFCASWKVSICGNTMRMILLFSNPSAFIASQQPNASSNRNLVEFNAWAIIVPVCPDWPSPLALTNFSTFLWSTLDMTLLMSLVTKPSSISKVNLPSLGGIYILGPYSSSSHPSLTMMGIFVRSSTRDLASLPCVLRNCRNSLRPISPPPSTS